MMGKTRAKAPSIEETYVSHAGSLTRFLGRFLDSPAEVEDVLQEAFLKTFEAERKHHIDTPKSYIFKTARNLALNVISLRRRRRTESVADFETQPVLYELEFISNVDPESKTLVEEQLARAEDAIDQLTPRVREVFVLRKVYGLSHKEIAERLQISVSTVEKHVVRGTLEMKRSRQIEQGRVDGALVSDGRIVGRKVKSKSE